MTNEPPNEPVIIAHHGPETEAERLRVVATVNKVLDLIIEDAHDDVLYPYSVLLSALILGAVRANQVGQLRWALMNMLAHIDAARLTS